MQDQDVPVRILEEPHVTDAGVDRVAEEPHAGRLELRPGRRDIGDAESDPGRVRGEGDVLRLRLPQRERDVAGLELVRAAPPSTSP